VKAPYVLVGESVFAADKDFVQFPVVLIHAVVIG
jgi:hypothetical protein